jgi:hypothetical protein
MKNKRDLLIILLLELIAAVIVLHFELGYLPTMALFMGSPGLYISIKNKRIIKKPLEFSLLTSIPAAFMVDYLGHINNAWHTLSSVNILIFGAFPADSFIWGFLYTYLIIIFYEHFFDNTKNNLEFSKNTKKLVYITYATVLIFGILLLFYPNSLHISWLYIKLIVGILLIPTFIITWKCPKLIKKILPQTVIFFTGFLIYEIIAIHLGQWQFNGTQYIGWIELFDYGFPFEELLWMILAVPASICIYEYFVDDHR